MCEFRSGKNDEYCFMHTSSTGKLLECNVCFNEKMINWSPSCCKTFNMCKECLTAYCKNKISNITCPYCRTPMTK